MKNIKVPLICKIIICALTFIFSYFSCYFASYLKNILPIQYSKMFGALILIAMGLVVVFKTIKEKFQNKEFNYFEIMDYDKSKSISIVEAFFLTIALSIDSLTMNVAFSLTSKISILLPVFTALGQFIAFQFGIYLGLKSDKLCKNKIGKNLIDILPGFIFIIIGILRLVC